MLSWDELQVAEDAAGNLLYPGILEAWTNVSSFFPEVATFDDEHTSDSSEDDHSEDGPGPQDIGIGTNAAFVFNQTMIDAWGEANADWITEFAPENIWGNPIAETGITEPITVLQYEFAHAVMETIAMGVPSEPADGDNSVSFISSETGLAVLLDVSEGITVSGTGDDLIYSGNVTSITVRPENMAGDYLTATGLTDLTLQDDIAPIMMDDGDDDASSEANVTWSPNPLIDPATLTFTSDEEHIYAFTSTGEMVGQINFHTDENEWTFLQCRRCRGGKTVKNVHYDYNIHDADWNQVANSGGNALYIVEDDGTLVLDEVGSKVGFVQHKYEMDPAAWATFDPGDTKGTINFDNVTQIRYETHSFESVSTDNPYRIPDEDWSDSNVTIQYYEEVAGRGWPEFVGSKQERDGFIEIRDANWNVVVKSVDDTQAMDFDALVSAYGGVGGDMESAWNALSSSLPTAFQDTGTLSFTEDQWGNILIFSGSGDTSGEMIGQINYWSHYDEWDRSWDDEYPSQIHTNKNFHFQGIETQDDGNWHWVSIGEYGVGSDTLVAPDGTQVLESSWENVGQTIFESQSDNWDTTIKDEYFADAVALNLGSINGWEDINQIQVSTNSWQYEAVRWRNEVETESSIQVRFYQEIEMDGGNWYHNKFLGSMEKRDGFIEIRDENWNTVSRVIDPDSASGFADVLAQNPELDWAWDQVMPYLPDEAQDRDALSFTQDEYQIYAFDDQGNMVVQINIWSWTDSFMTNGDTVLREETSTTITFRTPTGITLAQQENLRNS